MTLNKTTFSAPSPVLTTVSAAITTLESAQSAFKGKTGSRVARDNAWTVLLQLMQQLRGKTWIGVPPSTQAHTTLTGLQSATTVSYRHRPITKAGAGVWSQTVTAVVT